MKKFGGRARVVHGRKLVVGAALLALFAAGSVAGASKLQDSLRADQRGTATASGPALRYEGDRLGEEAPSPFIQGQTRGSFQPVASSDSRIISFANGIRFDTRQGAPALARELSITGYPATRPGYHLVQFDGPILSEWKTALERAGAEIIGYVPNNAYLVKVDANHLDAVSHADHVVWTGLYQPAYKLSAAPEMDATRPGRQEFVVLLFPGESLGAVEQAITSSGGAVKESANSRNLLIRADMDRTAARALALRPDVAWIEPWYPRQPVNDLSQWVLQTFVVNSRRFWDNGITGAGQVVNSVDTGINMSHNMFRDPAVPVSTFGDYPTHRKIIAYHESIPGQGILFGDATIFSYHGSHTGCTLVGNDAAVGGTDVRDGMAKDAKNYFLDAGDDATGNLFIPVDLYGMYLDPYNGNGGGAARLSSNSWGGTVAGAYDTEAMQVDQFMWDHKDFLLAYSNGNSSTAGSVGSPASAKDCISVGGTGRGTGATSIYTATSRGPAADGRRKPTICAPATNTSANGPGSTAMATLTGTSMSCPGVIGTMALAREYLMDGRYPGGSADPAHAFTPTAALLKAVAVNSGQNDISGFTVPDNNVGWGRVKLDDALFLPGDTRQTVMVDETDGLITGEYVEYEFWVSDTTLPLKISLVWTDYPGLVATSPELVNNLNLTATGGGFTYLGNVFSGGQSVTGGSADNLNVEECVWRTTPAAGLWKVRIDAANCPVGPQPFALVVSGGLGGNAGVVMLDQAQYGGQDTLHIRVEDLNAGASATVAVKSNTETTSENVILPQTGTAGVYQGTFPLTLTGATHADGKLSVSHGDTVTVSYTDSSPAHTSNARARVYLDAPTITGVGPLDVGSTAAVIGWTTSSPASSKIYYGTTPVLGSFFDSPSLVTSHSVTLTGLANNTTYFYDVESADHEGNTVRDDNGGAHYRFTTRVKGDILLVYGDNTFTEQAKYDTAVNRTGWTIDKWDQGQGANPPLGNLASGLRSYRGVWWQVGWEQYPCFTDAARDSLTAYHAGGGRISYVSHDVAWDFSDATNSPDWTAARQAWYNNELHETWLQDPTTWSANRGITADPISGAYLLNIPYTAFRSGGAGDQIASNPGTGTGAICWTRPTPAPSLNCAVRWTSAGPQGSPGSAVWGGTPTQQVVNNYEWSRLNAATADDTTRAGILDKTLIWLIGRDHPTITVTSPNGGETFTTSPVAISWTETFDGATVGSRKIEYSDDGGQSWTLITSSPGTSPYSWNVSSLPNSNLYRVRVTVVDNGSPTLTGQDASNANFTLNRPGGDTRGPVVVAGSMQISPNPAVAPGNFVLNATVDDSRTGNNNVTQAEWSVGPSPAPAGGGIVMSGSFTSPTVAARDTIDASTFPAGTNPLWVRGRDAAGSWGPADSLMVVDNGGARTSIASIDGPAVFGLERNTPNPFNPVTTIRFGIAATGPATLAVYDVNGRLVRTLVEGSIAAGRHEVRWDGRDNGSHAVASGVYFARLESGGRAAEQKMVLMK